MTPAELEVSRRLLFLSVKEASEWVSKTSQQAWYRWENGLRPIPDNVKEFIGKLIDWRQDAVKKANSQIMNSTAMFSIIWYRDLKDWLSLPDHQALMYRPNQSVASELRAIHPLRVNLIEFNPVDYGHWLENKKDTEAMRIAWAENTLS